jgi:hypothetical protein
VHHAKLRASSIICMCGSLANKGLNFTLNRGKAMAARLYPPFPQGLG